MARKGKPAPIRFTWRYTRTRGWEGRRLGERLLKPEYGYRVYAVQLWLLPMFHLPRRRWQWVVQRNYEQRGRVLEEHLAMGEVEYGGDVVAAREQAMREAEAAYLALL